MEVLGHPIDAEDILSSLLKMVTGQPRGSTWMVDEFVLPGDRPDKDNEQSGYICTFKNTKFWLFLAPPTDPVKFLWFKMTGTGVPHIVLHVSCWTHTSRGYLRPQKSVLSKKYFLLFLG